MFHEYLTNVTCIFLGRSKNTEIVFSSGLSCYRHSLSVFENLIFSWKSSKYVTSHFKSSCRNFGEVGSGITLITTVALGRYWLLWWKIGKKESITNAINDLKRILRGSKINFTFLVKFTLKELTEFFQLPPKNSWTRSKFEWKRHWWHFSCLGL